MGIKVTVGKNNYDRKQVELTPQDTPRYAIEVTGFASEAYNSKAIHMNAVPLFEKDLDKTFEQHGISEIAIITWDIAKVDNA